MKTFHVTCVAAILVLGSGAALAVDMTPEQRGELRERADALQAERQRNPSWDGGTRRLNEPRGDVRLDQNRGEVNTRTTSKVPKSRGEGVKKKVKRTVKDLPGALVRRAR